VCNLTSFIRYNQYEMFKQLTTLTSLLPLVLSQIKQKQDRFALESSTYRGGQLEG